MATPSHFSLDYLNLPNEVKPGSHILIDDGLIDLKVDHVEGADMHCIVMNNGEIGESARASTSPTST